MNDNSIDSSFVKLLKKHGLEDTYSDKKTKLPIRNNFSESRDFKNRSIMNRAKVRDSAVENKLLKFSYRKPDGTLQTYVVEPYSYKNVRDNGVVVKKLFAWDIKEGKIKSFAVRSIIKAEVEDKSFNPRFPIEIAEGLKDFLKVKNEN